MKGGSTASSASGSIGECPFCFVPLIRIQSKQEGTKDIWFVKCPYNVKGDPTTCGFIRSEAEYEANRGRERRLKMKDTASLIPMSAEFNGASLKEEVAEVRQILDILISDICSIKAQLGEPKVVGGEPKVAIVEQNQDVVNTKKVHIVLDSTCITPLIVGFVGALLGAMVVSLWK